MVIGGNGIGKTTLVNTILYALVGNAQYEAGRVDPVTLIDRDYFKGRVEPADQERAQVTLTFGFAEQEITITRALYRPRILRIEVSNKETQVPKVLEGDPERLENEYRELMQQMLGIRKFEHFVLVVANLLVFSEDRRTLIWDTENQNRIIQLLFMEGDFEETFDELNRKMVELDTKARHTSEARKDINKFLKLWLKEKESISNENTVQPESIQEETQFSLADLQTKLIAIKDEISELEDILESEISQLKSLVIESDEVAVRRTALIAQLGDLERQFYSKVYQNVPPDYVLILESLIKNGICTICGATGRHLKKLGQELKDEGKCIVCGSPVAYAQAFENSEDKVEDNLSETINMLRERLEQLDTADKDYTTAQSTANIEINRIQDNLSEKKRQQRYLETKIMELRSQNIILDDAKPLANSQKDVFLEEQQLRIEQLEAQTADLYQQSREAQQALSELNKELEEVLSRVNEELSPLFSYFASRFLGTDCELVVTRRLVRRRPVSYMYPRFYGKDRSLATHVSESQRFFLDQAFRMAFINWFTQKEGAVSFFIVETPEGSLDLAYERNVADMYTEFASYDHTIIVTSNLNSSNFLRGLYDNLGDTGEREERTLHLLNYGKPSSIQQQEHHVRAFNRSLHDLQLEQLRLPHT